MAWAPAPSGSGWVPAGDKFRYGGTQEMVGGYEANEVSEALTEAASSFPTKVPSDFSSGRE